MNANFSTTASFLWSVADLLRVIACVDEPALIRNILAHAQARDELDGPAARAPRLAQTEDLKLR
jgi:hypothetical protein